MNLGIIYSWGARFACSIGGLDCESVRVDADALGDNEENHGDNGRLSVTCAQAVTHTIARDGIIQAFCATHRIYTLLDTGHW